MKFFRVLLGFVFVFLFFLFSGREGARGGGGAKKGKLTSPPLLQTQPKQYRLC